MVIRQLKKEQYEALCSTLYIRAYTDECSASYTLPYSIDHTHYILRLQPERHYKIAILQAIKEIYVEEEPHFHLITSNVVLSALLDLLVDQIATDLPSQKLNI